jgi:beta-glucosidase/6-phospho-beta-glucosidase/beta-galactosidase
MSLIIITFAVYLWDLPQILQKDYGGWPNSELIQYFVAFADLVFWSFGDRVKTFVTFNEPNVFCSLGYSNTSFVVNYVLSVDGKLP